ncbi:hypothetical protein HOK00_01470 [bacterium]|jgi:hypothetical protein|nr:hypothetical protein [bacterium]
MNHFSYLGFDVARCGIEHTTPEYTKSKNRIYFLIDHKGKAAAFLAVFTLVLGTSGYYTYPSIPITEQDRIFDAIFKAHRLFGFNFPSIDEFNWKTLIASFSAVATVAFKAVLFFFKKQINQRRFKKISKKKHIGIFGLGEIAKSFLDDEDLQYNAIIIEKDDAYADYYRSRGFGVKIGDAFSNNFLNNGQGKMDMRC